MRLVLLVSGLLYSVSVGGFKIVSKTEPVEDVESFASAPFKRPETDSPLGDLSTFEAVFAGVKKAISVDCTQPGIICKFPLVVENDETATIKPAKIRAVPVIKGVDASKSENSSKERVSIKSNDENTRVPVFKGSFDTEAADEKDIEDTWILEKNILNKKYKIPVKLVPSKPNSGTAPVFPMHHDYLDHYNGHPYNFPNRHGQWTPWVRSYPSVYNYPSNHNYPSSQPCHPPVYHHPPPCISAVAPTKKPTINVDDKVDKEED